MESLLYQVMRILSSVQDADRFGSLRQRYATEQQWQEESLFLEDHAMKNWFLAKRLICENKAQLEFELAEERKKWSGPTPGQQNVYAALAVIQKELDQEAELALTSKEIE